MNLMKKLAVVIVALACNTVAHADVIVRVDMTVPP